MNVNLTVINIDIVSIENNIFVQKYLLHYIQYLLQTLHYKEVTCTCGVVNKVVKTFSINTIVYNTFNKNTSIFYKYANYINIFLMLGHF